MATGEPVSAHLSTAEVTENIRELGTNDLSRLRRIARSFARFSPISADDLAQEALVRTMDGTRPCPRDVPVVHFLAGVMRSIASDAAKARRRHPERSLERMAEAGREWSDGSMTIEQELISEEEEAALMTRAAETKQLVLRLFDDDAEAQTIAEGLMDGWEGEELRSLTGLDKTAFASKRRLVRRRIAKAIPESSKS